MNINKLSTMLTAQVCRDVAGVILDFMDPCDVAMKHRACIANFKRSFFYVNMDDIIEKYRQYDEDTIAEKWETCLNMSWSEWRGHSEPNLNRVFRVWRLANE